MRTVDWMDEKGRKYRSLVPEDVRDEDAHMGIIVGPPQDIVDILNAPEPYATILHNQLFDRGLFSAKDVQRRTLELDGAVHVAFGSFTSALYETYIRLEKDDKISDNLIMN